MILKDAQQDLSNAYVGGSFGVLVSGLVWIAAALTLYIAGLKTSLIVFFIGGMFIYPASTMIDKIYTKGLSAAKDNPLPRLAMELTILLFVGLFLAFWLAGDNAAYFYAVMLLIIGARYVPFATLYGDKTYWVLGGVLMGFGLISFLYLTLPGYLVAGIGGAIEFVFALWLFMAHRKAKA